MIKCVKDEEGTKRWLNDQGQYHREDGPAVEYYSGSNHWYQNDKLHREDGPAVEYSDGIKIWYYRGDLIGYNQREFDRFMKLKAFY